MTEKHSPISRALIAAAKMPAPQARRILMLICESGMTMDVPQPTQGEIHYSKREKFIKRMKGSCDRVLNYARHETLRKVEKHFRENPIKAGEGEGHPFRGNQFTGGKEGPQSLNDALNTPEGAKWTVANRFEFIARYLQEMTGSKSNRDLIGGKRITFRKGGWNVIESNGARSLQNVDAAKLYDHLRRGQANYFIKEAEDLRIEVARRYNLE